MLHRAQVSYRDLIGRMALPPAATIVLYRPTKQFCAHESRRRQTDFFSCRKLLIRLPAPTEFSGGPKGEPRLPGQAVGASRLASSAVNSARVDHCLGKAAHCE